MSFASLADALDALLELTPEPPPTDADPGELVAIARDMMAAREPICRAIVALKEQLQTLPPAKAERYATLLERDARWTARLTTARHSLGERLASLGRARKAY